MCERQSPRVCPSAFFLSAPFRPVHVTGAIHAVELRTAYLISVHMIVSAASDLTRRRESSRGRLQLLKLCRVV